MKTFIVIALVLVVSALAGAGMFMLKKGGADDGRRDARMARALALRVGLSIALFLFILVAWKLGWITPTGLPVRR